MDNKTLKQVSNGKGWICQFLILQVKANDLSSEKQLTASEMLSETPFATNHGRFGGFTKQERWVCSQ